MIILTLINQSELCEMQHNTWQGNPYSAKLTAPRLIIACRWRTNVRWKSLHSFWLEELLPTKDLRKVSADLCLLFSSFMREYLNPVVKADQCAQNVDDIGIAANNATDLTRNIRAVFQCIRNQGLKLTIEKCHFGVRQVEFLGRTISSEGVSPQTHKNQNILSKLRFLNSKRALQRYLGFLNYYRNYIPRVAEQLNPFYKLLKAEVLIHVTSELKETFDSVNKALSDACELALKQSIPGKQLVLMTDASLRSASYALMIEGNLDQKMQSKR